MNPSETSGWTTVQKNSKKEKMIIDEKIKSPTNKATHYIIKETMNIEPEMMGFVIGRKGRNVKRLQEIYGVKIIQPPRGGSQIILEGTAKVISAAKQDIEENLSRKTSFFIEKDCISQVIGDEGKNIQALQDTLNISIAINREDGQVVVTGTRCEEAKRVIEDTISGKISFFIVSEFTLLVIGKGGEIVRSLREAHNVTITIQEDGEVVIVGKKREAAKRDIESMISKWKTAYPYEEKFFVPAPLIGYVIGKDGLNWRRIKTTYNIWVFTKPPTENKIEIILKGSTAEEVFAAKKDIMENIIWTTLDVDERFVGLIIGRGGERVLRLEKEYDVVIKVGQRDGKAYIMGKKDRTEAARDTIISIISEESKNEAE